LRPCSDERRRLRIGLDMVVAVALLFYTLTIGRTGPMAFGATFALAAACAITALSIERSQRGTFAAMVCAALLVLLYMDFEHLPGKGLSPFALSTAATFPDAMKDVGMRYLRIVLVFGLLA